MTTLMAGKFETKGVNLDTSTEMQVACYGLFVARCGEYFGFMGARVVQVLLSHLQGEQRRFRRHAALLLGHGEVTFRPKGKTNT